MVYGLPWRVAQRWSGPESPAPPRLPRIGRAEVKLPVDEGDTVLLPAEY